MVDQDEFELFKSQDGNLLAFNPEMQTYLPVNDVRERAKAITDQHPPSKEARRVFYQQRIKLVQASNLSDGHKENLVNNLRNSIKIAESKVDVGVPPSAPKPGGVGFGVYYKEDALTYETSSVLFYRIVAVPGIGADLNEWLYLTSTNHSPRGTEAYISYEKQFNPTFTVFDWSKPDDEQWVLCKPYGELSSYLTTHTADNHQYPTIFVVNSTRRIPGIASTWINEVMLLNKVTNAYDLVYSNEYELPESEDGNGLDWGPIVETFPPSPNETNRIGFFNAMLLLDGKSHKLTQEVTELRIDDPDFELVYFQPNFSFIVH